jgi:hypothetical protein
MSGSKWVESGMRRQVGICLGDTSVGQPSTAALGKSQAHDISAIGALEVPQLWRKNSQRAREKLIDGSFPQKTPRCRASADIDALCGGREEALTMMQVRIPSGGVLRGSFHTSPADVLPRNLPTRGCKFKREVARISLMIAEAGFDVQANIMNEYCAPWLYHDVMFAHGTSA